MGVPTHLPNEVRAPPEVANCTGGGLLKVSVYAKEFLVVEDDPFAEVVGFQGFLRTFVGGNLTVQLIHGVPPYHMPYLAAAAASRMSRMGEYIVAAPCRVEVST